MHYRLILLASILFFLCSCKEMKEPVFHSIQNVQMKKMPDGMALMKFEIDYFNPNDSKARLKKADGKAWLDSVYLGSFRVDTAIDIPANAHFLVPVKLEMEMKHLVMHSLAAMLKDELLLTIKGKAKVGKGGFYKRIPLQYEGKQSLKDLLKTPGMQIQ